MKQETEIVAIIPAAGVGSRMRATCPKQYLKINEQTLLEHTVYHLLAHSSVDKVILVISQEDEYFYQTSLNGHAKVKVAFGGKERADSVLAGLKATEVTWVLVHDAARPCVRHSDISLLIETAMNEQDGAILAIPARDTLKEAKGTQITSTLDRSKIWQAMTPQMFKRDQLIQALEYAKANNIQVTDDASAIELVGGTPRLVEGHGDNIKVTVPEDLALAAFFLNQRTLS